jgi:hypothetical protein
MTTASHTPRCAHCKRRLGRARIFINHRWTCPDCVYALERGQALEVTLSAPPARRRRAGATSLRPQHDTLFPLEQYDTPTGRSTTWRDQNKSQRRRMSAARRAQ